MRSILQMRNLQTRYLQMRWVQRGIALLIITVLGLPLLQPPTLQAQSVADAQWQAQYWNNATLAGAPVVTRTEPTPNDNWGDGAPENTGLPNDRFSARWQSTLSLPAGRYEFTVRADDGARLWVDGNQLIDEWTVQSVETFTAQTTLDGGPVAVRLDYFDNTGEALISLNWQRLDQSGPAALPTSVSAVGAPTNLWRGEYFANTNLSEIAFERNDAELNFDWGLGSPQSSALGNDRFSVRWSRTLTLAPGRYQFTATADDGVRVWVDGTLVINEWAVQAANTVETIVQVRGGPTPVRVEYFENSGQALIALTWRQVAPVITSPTPITVSTPTATPPTSGDTPSATMSGARYLNVRQGPGIQYERITIIANGEVVDYLGRAPSGIWVQVRLADGTVGWVNSRYFTSDTPVINLPVMQ